ncbi:MAG TPA: hypothetical protein PL099_03265 [Thermoclostridium caenicola]|nr:hypothetical protein [Thermoclostridium caenicola]
MKSRISFIRYLYFILMMLLVFRVFSIQAVRGEEYSEAAAVQRWRHVRIYTERGMSWTGTASGLPTDGNSSSPSFSQKSC